jgi:hypothetical protein
MTKDRADPQDRVADPIREPYPLGKKSVLFSKGLLHFERKQDLVHRTCMTQSKVMYNCIAFYIAPKTLLHMPSSMIATFPFILFLFLAPCLHV